MKRGSYEDKTHTLVRERECLAGFTGRQRENNTGNEPFTLPATDREKAGKRSYQKRIS